MGEGQGSWLWKVRCGALLYSTDGSGFFAFSVASRVFGLWGRKYCVDEALFVVDCCGRC